MIRNIGYGLGAIGVSQLIFFFTKTPVTWEVGAITVLLGVVLLCIANLMED